MQSSRRAAAAAITLSLALGGGTAVAHADGGTTIYVDGSSTSCTDSGDGSPNAPYCTIQAAANAAVAWDTVDIAAGRYQGPLTVSTQGKPNEPTVFQAVGGAVSLWMPAGDTAPGLDVDGASYVTFDGVESTRGPQLNVANALIENSTGIVLAGMRGDSIEVAGSADDARVEDDLLVAGSGITVDSGSSGDVISGNYLADINDSISVTGTENTAITSNTVESNNSAAPAISVAGASTGVSVENNIVTYPGPETPAEISVGKTAAAGTTEDYNLVWPSGGIAPTTTAAYSWAGTDYSSRSAFSAATGQGEHDIIADPELNDGAFSTDATAPQINSANYLAPGGLPATDLYGDPLSTDPAVAVPNPTYPGVDRGAVQAPYTDQVSAVASPLAARSVDLDSSLSQSVDDQGDVIGMVSAPTPAVTYDVNWGDGVTNGYPASSTEADTTLTHTYAKIGTYKITDTAHLTNGKTAVDTTSFTTAGFDYTAYGPTRILDTRKGLGAAKAPVQTGDDIRVKIAGVGSIPSDVTAVALNLTATDTTVNGYLDAVPDGNGRTGSNLGYLKGQTVANNAIVPVASDGYIDIYNEGDSGGTANVLGDVSGYFTRTTASAYTPVTEDRLLDTRNATGARKAKIAAGSNVPVAIAGADSIPTGVTAVAVHVTVTDATGNGWIAAEADGAGTPSTSTLNYRTGQTISNTVIVPVATNGKIELYNGGESGSVDLLADVTGYFSAAGTEEYVPITPYRAWDSRTDGNALVPGGTETYQLAELDGTTGTSFFPANATLVTNLTVTDVTASGYITAFPAKTARPGISNLNYLKGQTVTGLGIVSSTGADQDVSVYNSSTGRGDLIVDVFGYFANS